MAATGQTVSVENPRRRDSKQDSFSRPQPCHPPDEGKNRQVAGQQSERVRSGVGRGKHDVVFQAKEDAGEKSELHVEQFAGGSKQKVDGTQHREGGRNLECDFTAAQN
jgi:hypothetical protein